MKFFATLLLLALVCAAFAAWLVYAPIGPPAGTPDTSATFIDIAPGTGSQSIATQLERAGILRSRYAFLLLRAVKGGKLMAGEYRFNHPAPATEIYARIARGDVYTIALTIPEGYNIFDIAQAVQSAGLGSRDGFLAAERSDTALIADLSPHAPSLEGYLFPDTYRFARHVPPTQILSTMVRRFRAVTSELNLSRFDTAITRTPSMPGAPEWSDPLVVGADGKIHAKLSTQPDVNQPLNLAQIVILASLIEKEVADPSERPLVASVFENRLAAGMPLATDPSVVYAALLEGRYRGTIYESDLQSPSPYNTYRHPGLPPGPIANPGIAALKAALAPAHTSYLYFVADAQGHSRFSTTLAEHAQQVQSYRRALQTPSR